MSKKSRLEFLKRILTDTVPNEDIRTLYFNEGIIPDEDIVASICQSPVEPKRLEGLDWPERAHTMIGVSRLNNLHDALDKIRAEGVEGDFIETGVWRGGASIFISLYNSMYKMDRKVFVADSFEGLPLPDTEKYPADAGDIHHTIDFLKVSLEEVRGNFDAYDALTDDVVFLKGWFSDTLPENKEIDKIALLRFDGDMYGSTMDVLNNLYDKVVSGGIIIIDDYCLPNCIKAVTDFRASRSIEEELVRIDTCGVFWVKK